MKRIPEIDEFIELGLTLQEASMAVEAMASAVIEGAEPITAKRMVELIRGENEKRRIYKIS